VNESYTLRVNGDTHDVHDAWIGESLLYVLRERLGLPAAKAGCEQGECGSCSVLLDDALVCACLVLAASAGEREIVTPEGLQPGERAVLTAVQRAFVEEGAVQCGFCTPGLVMAVHDLLAHDTTPS
jgi:carbon-monoxide dehydrogenase small subunit